MTTPLLGVVCHPQAGTCYDHTYHTGSLYLHSLWR